MIIRVVYISTVLYIYIYIYIYLYIIFILKLQFSWIHTYILLIFRKESTSLLHHKESKSGGFKRLIKNSSKTTNNLYVEGDEDEDKDF